MNVFKQAQKSFNTSSKLLSAVKLLSQLQCILGFVMLTLATLADYMSSRIKTLRLSGLEECCSVYFLLTGMVGLAGVLSSRRAFIAAFVLMSLHATVIFVPCIIIASSFDIHFYQHSCFGECDWHLLATSMPSNSRCQILCGDGLTDNQKSQMTRLGTDVRLDAGLIACACIELIAAILTVLFAGRLLCLSNDKLQDKHSSEMLPLNTDSSKHEDER